MLYDLLSETWAKLTSYFDDGYEWHATGEERKAEKAVRLPDQPSVTYASNVPYVVPIPWHTPNIHVRPLPDPMMYRHSHVNPTGHTVQSASTLSSEMPRTSCPVPEVRIVSQPAPLIQHTPTTPTVTVEEAPLPSQRRHFRDPMVPTEQYMKRFPMEETITFEELDILTDKLFEAFDTQNYLIPRLVRKYDGDWRQVMGAFLRAQEKREKYGSDAIREKLKMLPYSLKQCPNFAKAWPARIGQTTNSGNPVLLQYMGRLDRLFVKNNMDQIVSDWVTYCEMESLNLDRIGPEANAVAVLDFYGLNNILSDIQVFAKLASKMRGSTNPGNHLKPVLINLPPALQMFISAQLKVSGLNSSFEVLPFPYSLERLLELTSLGVMRQHAKVLRQHPMEGKKQVVPSGDMAEVGVDVRGPVKWAVASDKTVELRISFISEAVEEVVVCKACSEQAGCFVPPGPGLLWVRAINQGWVSAKITLLVQHSR